MQNVYFIRCTLIALVSFSLLGCISSDAPPSSTYYYVLDASPSEVPANKNSTRNVKLSSIDVPDYLKQPSLVLKLSDHQIKIANYHFWAEDMRSAIRRVLLNELNKNHPNINLVKQCVACDELSFSINHFYPTESGDVVLSGSYELQSTDKQAKSQTRRYAFTLQTSLEKGGFDESASKMYFLLQELAQQVAL